MEQRILDWNDFRSSSSIKGFSTERKKTMDEHLARAERFLESGNAEFFCRILPSPEHWRLYEHLRDEAAYLDIETDGRYRHSNITLLSVHRKDGTITLVKGQNLDRKNIEAAFRGTKLLVTFNGGSFDLPILEYHFPFSVPKVPHFDLRTGCGRIGLKGGLKSAEKKIGIVRGKELEYMTGEEAVYLWRAWERSKSLNALRLLKRYNIEDTENLEPLAEHVYETLKRRTFDGRHGGSL